MRQRRTSHLHISRANHVIIMSITMSIVGGSYGSVYAGVLLLSTSTVKLESLLRVIFNNKSGDHQITMVYTADIEQQRARISLIHIVITLGCARC